jgi:alpha-mannosidase
MHDDRNLVEARLRRFVTDHVLPAIYREVSPLRVSTWTAPGEPVGFAEALAQPFEPADVGLHWGRPWGTTWLRIEGDLPSRWLDSSGRLPGGTRAEVVIDLGFNRSRSGFQAEGLAYRPDGSLVKAISPLNSYLPVDEPTESIDVYLEAAANPDVAGEYSFNPTTLGDRGIGEELLYQLRQVDVGLFDIEVWELTQDIWTLRGLMEQLPTGLSRRHEILRALESMMDAIDPTNVSETASSGRAALATVLASPASASAHRIIATGHAHIDSAWLWPFRETVRKCARTFTNVMALMDEYPDFVFACSSAQQFAWMKEFYPDIFEKIKEKVAGGQFVPVGGMWVESDTNMPGSEAMARQFLAGKRFFLEEFGIDSEEAWLPDSFGYSGNLPQIVAGAGEKWFLTQKISWNQVNRMPHHTFWWEGIDGTRVFTHFPPADTYISELNGAELAHAEHNFSEKGFATMSLVPFGWGDGGGGPTREMMAAARRLKSLDGSPTVTVASPREFFAAAQAEYPDAPVWAGEMYLELHRGVFTSQLRTKQGNRRSEHLLREAEFWATAASVRAGFEYPFDELEVAWRSVLLLQFHDVLPGSSIAWVHREAEEKYEQVRETLEAIIAASLAALVGTGERELVANASPNSRSGIPALGIGNVSEQPATRITRVEGGHELTNGLVRVTVTDNGTISSLASMPSGRDVIPHGVEANVLRLHTDLPNLWDAWDIDAHYKRTVVELDDIDSQHVSDGADGAFVTTMRSFGTSTMVQRVGLRPGATAVDIDMTVDWNESEKLLKLAFPLDVHAERVAAETQYGHVFRATHVNTSWDAARFEACQHRWLHLGEPGFGVAIANDSTYGYDVERSVREDGETMTTARFSILRAPLFPDPQSDQGVHTLSFRVAPDAAISDAVELGYDLNLPERTVLGGKDVAPIVTSSSSAMIVEALKLAEDRSGDVIVRVYESLGTRAKGTLVVDFDYDAVEYTDLIERATGGAPLADAEGGIALTLRPFQFRTLRFSGVRARQFPSS